MSAPTNPPPPARAKLGDRFRNAWQEDEYIPPGTCGAIGKVYESGTVRVDYENGRSRHYDEQELAELTVPA